MTKTVFVSGGSRGIGEAVVKEAAGKYNVAFTYNNSRERAEELARELDKKYGGILCVHCDVRDEASVSEAVKAAKKRFGSVDILVNNAGVTGSGLLLDMPYEKWRDVFDVNVDGAFRLTKALLSDIIARKGNIINIASVWGVRGASVETAYSASKAALIGFTHALAKELAPMGVRVNAVAPGAIDTDMMKEYSDKEVEELISSSIPLGRLGRAEEVAKAVMFLAESEYISSEVLGVTGMLS